MPSKLNLNEADFTIPFSVTKTTHGSTVITDSDDQLLAVLSSPTASQVGPLFATAPELYDALADTLRILEAVKLSAGLGPKQVARMDVAKAALAKAGA